MKRSAQVSLFHRNMVTRNNTSAVTESFIEQEKEVSASSEPHLILQVLFGAIAGLAVIGNGVLCVVILRDRRRFLRSSYNLLIFTLAVTDTLTGFFIASTPGYIIGLSSYPVPRGIGGDLFCRLISTQYFVFVFGKVSVLTITALALERWYSIVRPLQYRLKFAGKRVYVYIGVICLSSCVFNGSKPLKSRLDQTQLRCVWSGVSYPKQIFIPTYTVVTFFVPTAITWASFFHVSQALKKSLAQQNENFRSIRKKLTRMCAIISFLLSTYWLPNQIFYTLSAFDITKTETPVHHCTIVLAMFNSCINPWVCCFTNREYMQGFKKLLGLKKLNSTDCSYRFSEAFESEVSDGIILRFRYTNSAFIGDKKGLELTTGASS